MSMVRSHLYCGTLPLTSLNRIVCKVEIIRASAMKSSQAVRQPCQDGTDFLVRNCQFLHHQVLMCQCSKWKFIPSWHRKLPGNSSLHLLTMKAAKILHESTFHKTIYSWKMPAGTCLQVSGLLHTLYICKHKQTLTIYLQVITSHINSAMYFSENRIIKFKSELPRVVLFHWSS